MRAAAIGERRCAASRPRVEEAQDGGTHAGPRRPRVVRIAVAEVLDRAPERTAGLATAYTSHGPAIYAYVRRMLGDESEAEDVTVTTFEKALRAWDRRPPDDGELRPWLFRIATNACLDELRRRRRARWQPWTTFAHLFQVRQVAPDGPEEVVLRQEQGALVRAALERLSPRDRAALVLRECQGLSAEEVGQALGVSRGAAKVVLFRARERLRAAYLALGGELPGAARPADTGPDAGAPASMSGPDRPPFGLAEPPSLTLAVGHAVQDANA